MREEVLDCHYVRLREGGKGEARMLVVEHDGTERALSDLIGEAGIIINGTLQEPNHPFDYVTESERACLIPTASSIDLCPLP